MNLVKSINSKQKSNIKYELKKKLFSLELTEYFESDYLDVLDLKNRLLQLVDCIESWNS
jgi:hypothetical protein